MVRLSGLSEWCLGDVSEMSVWGKGYVTFGCGTSSYLPVADVKFVGECTRCKQAHGQCAVRVILTAGA